MSQRSLKHAKIGDRVRLTPGAGGSFGRIAELCRSHVYSKRCLIEVVVRMDDGTERVLGPARVDPVTEEDAPALLADLGFERVGERYESSGVEIVRAGDGWAIVIDNRVDGKARHERGSLLACVRWLTDDEDAPA